MKSERIAKRASFGSMVLRKLSDITNLQNVKVMTHDEKPPEISDVDRDYVDQLIKERRNLMKLVAERNKIIELTGAELQNLRVNLQKLQLQNWNLAQSNSQMIAEINFGRERVKALQHELVCKEALLKVKNFGNQGKTNGSCRKTGTQEGGEESNLNPGGGTNETESSRHQNRRRAVRSRSVGPPATSQKAEEDREKVENKRRCLKRQSARFKSDERERSDNFFEIKCRIGKEEEEEAEIEGLVSKRPSMGRPSRRAVGKVQSYKEVPLNVKMRRE